MTVGSYGLSLSRVWTVAIVCREGQTECGGGISLRAPSAGGPSAATLAAPPSARSATATSAAPATAPSSTSPTRYRFGVVGAVSVCYCNRAVTWLLLTTRFPLC